MREICVRWVGMGILVLILLSGCSSTSPVVPPELEAQVDSSLAFSQIIAAPEAHAGRTVLLGGEILSAKRVADGTRFEVLQLPVTDSQEPLDRRSESQGRFLALQRGELDPASLPPGTRLTLVGEVTGASTQRLDDSDYRYPTVDVKHLHVWDERDLERRRQGSAPLFGGLFGGIGFGSGGRSGSFGGVNIGTGF